METGRPECGHESDTSLCCVLFARNVLPGPRTAEARSHAGRLTVPQYIRPEAPPHFAGGAAAEAAPAQYR